MPTLSSDSPTKSIEVRQKNIHVIEASVNEIKQCMDDIMTVGKSFLDKTAKDVPCFEKYVHDFIRMVKVIRKVVDNSLSLGEQVVLSINDDDIDKQKTIDLFQEILDRIFEMNILNKELEGFDVELKKHLKPKQRFKEKERTRRSYVDEIVKKGKIAIIRDLYTLNVRRGLL